MIASRMALQTEDSLLFRWVVQILVSVGIVATDVAAGTFTSLWAIPLGALGAWWSWRRRKQANVGLKIGLAIAMVVVLVTFLIRLSSSLDDTRAVLADLLIQLQVLHSFDLPRRKDLGYSMVIGLILLAVAATLSQTLLFAPLLLLFLILGLASLRLDYRSQLGLPTAVWPPRRWQLGSWELLRLSGLTVALGLVLFVAMPRLPGFQLRTFPASGAFPQDIEDAFDETASVNESLSSAGLANSDALSDGDLNALFGSGRISLDTYFGFGDSLDMRLVGRVDIEPRTVMRVRSQAPSFWRVVAFDRYGGRGWTISRRNEAERIQRNAFANRFQLSVPITRLPEESVVQTYTLVADLPSLMPHVPAPQWVYLPSQELGIDAELNLRAPGVLPAGMTYTIVSRVPRRDRTQLQGARLTNLSLVDPEYLALPAEFDLQWQALAVQITEGIESPFEQALAIGQYLKQNYQLRAGEPVAIDRDAVQAFFEDGGGRAEQFSSALALMLRSLGIPTRLVAGYQPGQFNPFTGFYVVRNVDASVVADIWLPTFGWFLVDPVPGRELLPPSISDTEPYSALKAAWEWFAGILPPPLLGWLNGVIVLTLQAFQWLANRLRDWVTSLDNSLLLVASLFGLTGLAVGAWEFGRWWRWQRYLARLAAPERLYARCLRRLDTRRQLKKRPSQTPAEFQVAIAKQLSTQEQDILRQLTTAYLRWRYAGIQPSPPELQGLQQLLKTL